MAAEAASLVVMSSLHLAGRLTGRKPFDPTRAGIAEAAIGVVLASGAVALLRGKPAASSVAIAANLFAIAGFAVGLTRTAQGGGAIDIGYHLTVLPLIVLTLVVLVRARRRPTDGVTTGAAGGPISSTEPADARAQSLVRRR
jgi:hypothetical protein